MKKIQNQAFTLVELIVVITILAILWTIAFLSFQLYSKDTRDGVRIADMNNINKWLVLYQLKWWIYPKPDNFVTISASGTIIWYEWVVWENVSRIINTNKIILDPLDNTSYVYYTNATNTTYQLLWYLEWNSLTINNLISITYAATDYTKRYPKVQWNNIWILLDIENNPITTDIDLFWTQSGTIYNSYISNSTIKTLSWVDLWWPLITLSRSTNFEIPATCPDWFIKVPWNEEFMQPWFCVAKYEMTYADATTPDSCDTQYPTSCTANYDWNTVRYQPWKTIVSKAWLYPIANITQEQAIDACKSMWVWYHLITNAERMTIARNIEMIPSNWSGKAIWSWYIYNWLSNSTMWCLWVSNTIYTLSRATASKTWEWNTWTGVTTCDPYRKYTLSNWETIWDLAGNLWEHENKANTIDWTNYNLGQTSINWSSNWIGLDDDGKYDINDMKKYWSSLWLWIINGMWNINYADWMPSNIFLYGAGAGASSTAGVFAMQLNRTSTNQSRNMGFRCAK